jgi:hypothetical protein
VLGIADALVCRIDGRSLPISLHELCRESSLQLPCQGGRVGSVPCSLMPLNEALPTAIDLAGKVGSQRREAATELNFRSFPGWQRGLCGFRCGDVIRCWIWMAGVCILLNLDERFVLRSNLSSQERGPGDKPQGLCLGPLARGCSEGETYPDLLDWLPL